MYSAETTGTGTVLTPNNNMLKAYKTNSGKSVLMSNGGNMTMGTSGIDEPDATHHEINPTIYEELKLGSEGAGFKKLVP